MPEYEKRSQGSIRGDSKKFAFQKAGEYIATYGISPEFMSVEDGETRFKEQIYNWFKNTVGRNRRKAEGRTRPSSKKPNGGDEKGNAVASGSGLAPSAGIGWNAEPATTNPNLAPYPGHAQEQQGGGPDGKTAGSPASSLTNTSTGQLLSPMQYSPMNPHPSSYPPNPHPNNAAASSSNSHNLLQNHSLPRQQSSLNQINNGQNILVTQTTLREAFSTLDPSSIANMIQNFISNSHPSPTPLTPVVEALFGASVDSPPYNSDPTPLVRRYLEASSYLPSHIMHAGCAGPAAALRALQMQIRRNSIWALPSAHSPFSQPSQATSKYLFPGMAMSPATTPISQPSYYHPHGHSHHHHQLLQHQQSSHAGPSSSASPVPSTPSVTTSLSEDMQRIASERQRRKDHIQWARIHAAALELGMMSQLHGGGRTISMGSGTSDAGVQGDRGSLHNGHSGLGMGASQGHGHVGLGASGTGSFEYVASRAFSEMVARDAVWESDEAEWVAGIFVLKALIRTGMRGDRGQVEEYGEMLRSYEGRWKEIKDEVRQSMVTDVLFSAKEDLSRLETETLTSL